MLILERSYVLTVQYVIYSQRLSECPSYTSGYYYRVNDALNYYWVSFVLVRLFVVD